MVAFFQNKLKQSAKHQSRKPHGGRFKPGKPALATKGVSILLSAMLACSMVPAFSASAFALENEAATPEETAVNQPSETNTPTSNTTVTVEDPTGERDSSEGNSGSGEGNTEGTGSTGESGEPAKTVGGVTEDAATAQAVAMSIEAAEAEVQALAVEDEGIAAQADELAPGNGVTETEDGFTWKAPSQYYPSYSFEAVCKKNAEGDGYTLTVSGSNIDFRSSVTKTLTKYKITDLVVKAGSGTIAGEEGGNNGASFSTNKFPELLHATIEGATSVPEGLFRGTGSYYEKSKLESVTLKSVPVKTGMFYACKALKTVNLSGSIAEIGTEAFVNCSALETINIPSSVVTIGDSAFKGCAVLPSITFPVGLQEIGASAFSGCDGIASIVFPNSIKKVKAGSFNSCAKLSSVDFSAIKDFNAFVLEDLAFVGYLGNNYTNLKSVSDIKGMPYLVMARYGTAVFPAEVLPTPEQVATEVGTENITDGFLIRNGALELVVDASLRSSATIDLSGKKITTINNGVFKDFANLETIVFPDGLKSIGVGAFSGCSKLGGEITFPSTLVSLGEDCFNMAITTGADANVIFKSKLKTIPKNCFYMSSKLKAVSFSGAGSGVTAIAEQAFASCKLDAFDFKGCGVEVIGPRAFYGCYTSTRIGTKRPYKYEYSGFTEINLAGSKVQTIGEQAFGSCMGTKKVSLPQGVAIGKMAFDNCVNLETLSIGSGSVVGVSAFSNCAALKGTQAEDGSWSLVIPKQVKFISPEQLPGAVGAFQGCTALTSVDWRSTETIPVSCFSGCTSLTNAKIAAGTIDFQAFYKCTGLTEADLSLVVNCGDDVKWDNDRSDAFRDCTNLTKVTFSDKLKTLGGYAFYGCSKLKEVDLTQAPNLARIGGAAFLGCSALEEIYIPGNIKVVGNDAFTSCGTLRVVIAEGFELGGLGCFRNDTLSLLVIPPSAKSLNLLGAKFTDDSRVVLVDPQRTFNFDNETMDSVGGLREKGKVVIHGTDPGLKDDLTWRDLIVEIEPHDWISTESADAYGVGKHQVTYKCSGGTYGEYCHGRMLKNSTANDLNVGWSTTATAQNFFSMNLAEDVNVTAVYTVTSANADAWGVLAAPIRLSLSVFPTNTNTRAAAPTTFSLRAARAGAGMVDVYRMAISGGTPSLYQADVPVDANGFVEVLADRVGVYALVGEGAKYVPPVTVAPPAPEEPDASVDTESNTFGAGYSGWGKKPFAPAASEWPEVPAAAPAAKAESALSKTGDKAASAKATAADEAPAKPGADATPFVVPCVVALVGAAVGAGVFVRSRRRKRPKLSA